MKRLESRGNRAQHAVYAEVFGRERLAMPRFFKVVQGFGMSSAGSQFAPEV